MDRHSPISPSVCIALLLLATSASAATIDIRVATSSGFPVDEAVVYALPAQPLPVARKTSSMDQINRTFVPHVLPIQTGSWVEFPNSDQILHQVFSVSSIRKFSTPLYVGKPPRPIQFPVSGVAEVGCSIHEQMSAYIVVVDTPYFATTPKSGEVSLGDVMAGDYALRVWYPGMRKEPEPQKLTVGAGDHVKQTFVIAK